MTDPRTPQRRRAANRRGRTAEWIASVFLLLKGYQPVAWRVRTPAGEIDLIMRRKRTIVFVEVKQRASLDVAAEAITPLQQSRIARAASLWLARRPEFAEDTLRFDAVMIGRGRIRHVRDAFGADGRLAR
ncbi:MAG: YraN family protein [Pseudomonadota bacterium]